MCHLRSGSVRGEETGRPKEVHICVARSARPKPPNQNPCTFLILKVFTLSFCKMDRIQSCFFHLCSLEFEETLSQAIPTAPKQQRPRNSGFYSHCMQLRLRQRRSGHWKCILGPGTPCVHDLRRGGSKEALTISGGGSKRRTEMCVLRCDGSEILRGGGSARDPSSRNSVETLKTSATLSIFKARMRS